MKIKLKNWPWSQIEFSTSMIFFIHLNHVTICSHAVFIYFLFINYLKIQIWIHLRPIGFFFTYHILAIQFNQNRIHFFFMEPQKRKKIKNFSRANSNIKWRHHNHTNIYWTNFENNMSLVSIPIHSHKTFYVYLNVLCEDSKDICMGSKAHGI